jgi:predicted HicB family RNase H-like nuclease
MPKLNRKDRNKIASESITLRIEKDVLNELRNEAEQKMESINILSNQISKSYVTWHKTRK